MRRTEGQIRDYIRDHPGEAARMDKTDLRQGDTTAIGLSEKIFQGQVVKAMTERGWWHYHTHDARKSDPGFPDIIAGHDEHPDRLLIAELKSEEGVVTLDQKQMLDRFARMSCRMKWPEVFLWRPHHWEIIISVLESRGWPPYLAGEDTGRWEC